jgi:hypothetical protein
MTSQDSHKHLSFLRKHAATARAMAMTTRDPTEYANWLAAAYHFEAQILQHEKRRPANRAA